MDFLLHLPKLRLPVLALAWLLLCSGGGVVAEDESKADRAHRSYLESLRNENRFPTAVSCSQCHPDHFEEWSVSPHAYAMMSPVFNSMQAFVTNRTEGTNGDFCIRCHTAVGMEREESTYGSILLRSPAVREGVTCISCHRVSKDFGTTSGRFSLETGPLTNSVYGPTGNGILADAIESGDYGLVTDPEERGKLVHEEAIKSPVIAKSGQCGSCHDVNSPTGIRFESAFTEYKHSPAAEEGISCQDCHMGVRPGTFVPHEERYAEDGRDLNYAFEPAAKVRNSAKDPGEGKPTEARKRTNHMFIGPDYSIVHPGIFPHSLPAAEFTYSNRFRAVLAEQSKDLVAYLKTLSTTPDDEAIEAAENEGLVVAANAARKHALTDWLGFKWWLGWGSDHFETSLSETEKSRRLKGVGFPWEDPEEPMQAEMRRRSARLILDRQFNLLNRAHVERTRLMRRGIQFGEFRVEKNNNRALAFEIDVHNAHTGHAVPTGFDAERAMFVALTVSDANGHVIFKSGDRDPNGDVRDLHSSYVHAQAPKEGKWLAETDWKDALGLARVKEDLEWRLDPYLFSLQSKFKNRTLAGGEHESVLPVNVSLDPLPFVRPPTRAEIHSGRDGGARKHFQTIPPLSHKTADYRISRDQLTGAFPYTVRVQFQSQMVPVNLVKRISPVGFDMNFSAKEVGARVAFGHEVDARGTRKGGSLKVWEEVISIEPHSMGLLANFRPAEEKIMHVPVSEYPFPHTPEAELKAREKSMSGNGEAKEFIIKHLGPLLPDLWPGGIPDGLSLFPENPVLIDEKAATKPNGARSDS
ncbi:multiheme c-type cytochrome [Verrucomicrobiales bacterium BCK34]|nr:multiheme c-type cytochrome [Verrucomicrobiales bacterium BCK34]